MSAAAALFAVDPCGLGGVALRAGASSARDDWLLTLKTILPAGTPLRRVPLNINDGALLGGLDLGATLNSGRPVPQQGVLAHADGGVVVLAMAERLSRSTAARLAVVLDTQEVAVERDGLALRLPARLGVVALDEGLDDDERVPAALLDRLAFLVQLEHPGVEHEAWDCEAEDIAQARLILPRIIVPDDILQALCAAATSLGVHSLRAPLFALKAARCAAALEGTLHVTQAHAALAARLVLAPRATLLPSAKELTDQVPQEEQNKSEEAEETERAEQAQNSEQCAEPPPDLLDQSDQLDQTARDDQPQDISSPQALAENITNAAKAAIPAGLLAALQVGQAAKARAQAAGRSGAAQKNQSRGRPMGARRGEPRSGARLNVIETLRAAAPWQKLRRLQSNQQNPSLLRANNKPHLRPNNKPNNERIHVQREDFHVTRFKQSSQTTTLFVVDASGSSALHRLAEAKGAVELLLADCYVRRDRVSVLAFRGKAAELLLPPTRSLARAKRALAGLPGGGGTPLASAIDAARDLATQISRRGETPIIVLLTDGRGNIARDGSPGRTKASEDTSAAARQLRVAGFTVLLLDTSPQPQPAAQMLATEMGAAYVPLPHAGAQAVSRVVRLASLAAR